MVSCDDTHTPVLHNALNAIDDALCAILSPSRIKSPGRSESNIIAPSR